MRLTNLNNNNKKKHYAQNDISNSPNRYTSKPQMLHHVNLFHPTSKKNSIYCHLYIKLQIRIKNNGNIPYLFSRWGVHEELRNSCDVVLVQKHSKITGITLLKIKNSDLIGLQIQCPAFNQMSNMTITRLVQTPQPIVEESKTKTNMPGKSATIINDFDTCICIQDFKCILIQISLGWYMRKNHVHLSST